MNILPFVAAGVQRAVHGGEGLPVLAGAGLHGQAGNRLPRRGCEDTFFKCCDIFPPSVDHDCVDRVRGVPEHGRLLGRHPALLGALGQDARRRRRAPRRLHIVEVSTEQQKNPWLVKWHGNSKLFMPNAND